MLLHPIKDSEELFDGTPGKWNTDPVEIDLNPDSKTPISRYYPVPHINKETFRKEIIHLIEIVVLTLVQQSEYGTPVFIIAKKEGTVRFLADLSQVNKIVFQKPYPIPRIGDTMQQFEGFQFATTLDLKTGYYTIQLDTKPKDITNIVTEFGKFQ